MVRIKKHAAINQLKAIGYRWRIWKEIGTRDAEKMGTPAGEKIVKIVPRKFNPDGNKYFIGVAYQLFGKVDEWAFWFEKESVVFIVPDEVLSRIWRDAGKPISQSDQWAFNLDIRTGEIKGYNEFLLDYRHELNNTG